MYKSPTTPDERHHFICFSQHLEPCVSPTVHAEHVCFCASVFVLVKDEERHREWMCALAYFGMRDIVWGDVVIGTEWNGPGLVLKSRPLGGERESGGARGEWEPFCYFCRLLRHRGKGGGVVMKAAIRTPALPLFVYITHRKISYNPRKWWLGQIDRIFHIEKQKNRCLNCLWFQASSEPGKYK